jgi:hypothetical protein
VYGVRASKGVRRGEEGRGEGEGTNVSTVLDGR